MIFTFAEKKDLVELVIRENGGGHSRTSASSHRNPVERQRRQAPSSYTASTHRHEWMAKMEKEDEEDEEDEDNSSDLVRDFVVVSSPEGPEGDTSTATSASGSRRHSTSRSSSTDDNGCDEQRANNSKSGDQIMETEVQPFQSPQEVEEEERQHANNDQSNSTEVEGASALPQSVEVRFNKSMAFTLKN